MPRRHTNVQVAPCTPQHIDQEIIIIETQWGVPPPQQQQQQQQQGFTTGQTRILLQQLDSLGWDKVQQVSADLAKITLQLQDASNRRHVMDIQLSGFPVAAPAVTVELPTTAWKPKWLPGHSLCQLVAQMQQVLDSFQAFWEQLEDLDQHTQLLDPAAALSKPYSCSRRCIALGNGCSCQLQLDPARPLAMPQPVFHGPSSTVAELQSRWFGNAHLLWDAQQSVRRNLQNVLQIQLPAPKAGTLKGCAAMLAARSNPAGAAAAGQGAADGIGEPLLSEADDDDDDDDDMSDGVGACAICYALHLPDPARPEDLGAVPSVSCTGRACGRVFHGACLAEWLGALPNNRRVFDTLFGSCPFCNTDISVSTRSVM